MGIPYEVREDTHLRPTKEHYECSQGPVLKPRCSASSLPVPPAQNILRGQLVVNFRYHEGQPFSICRSSQGIAVLCSCACVCYFGCCNAFVTRSYFFFHLLSWLIIATDEPTWYYFWKWFHFISWWPISIGPRNFFGHQCGYWFFDLILCLKFISRSEKWFDLASAELLSIHSSAMNLCIFRLAFQM